MTEEIEKLKKEKDTVILAHYYVDGKVQEIADYVGDSFYLSKLATTVKQKNILFCGVSFMGESAKLTRENVQQAKELHPEALVLAHPECSLDVLQIADFVGSTAQIIDYAAGSGKNVFIICTEIGIFYELQQKNPDKKFYSAGHRQFCPNMKKISLDKVLYQLQHMDNSVELDETIMDQARRPLERMLVLGDN